MTTIPFLEFDKMMQSHQAKAGVNTVKLGPGIYETRGDKGWWLPPDVSLVGSGIDKTIIRRVDPACRLVVNGWVAGSVNGRRISDLTIDANASLKGTEAPCGIGLFQWLASRVERIRVIGLGSFNPSSESFGIILADCRMSMIQDCYVDSVEGGYVTAFCVSGVHLGILDCTAQFRWQTGWDWRRTAFAMGGSSGEGSKRILIQSCRTKGANVAVFCDSGVAVDGLTVTGCRGKLRNWGSPYAVSAVALQGKVNYRNVVMRDNKWS